MDRLNQIRGLWWAAWLTGTLAFEVSGQTNLPPVIPVADATNYLYQQVLVRDVVAQVALRSTVALLNLNQKYPGSPLTCVIEANHTNRFPDLDGYLGQLVEVSGRITAYQGRPQIILTSSNQIRLIDAAPASSPPLPASEEPISVAAVAGPPAITPPPATPTGAAAGAEPSGAAWWIVGISGVVIGLLGASVFWLWRRGVGGSSGAAPPLALARATAPLDATTDSQTAEEWRQRALVAEAMAGQHGQRLRERLMPELLDFAKQSLVQGLYAQRNALLETQQTAQKALEEMERRLAALHLPSPERIRAYEQRIAELEKDVAAQGENVRELTRATLDLLRRKLESEREGSISLDWRGRPR